MTTTTPPPTTEPPKMLSFQELFKFSQGLSYTYRLAPQAKGTEPIDIAYTFTGSDAVNGVACWTVKIDLSMKDTQLSTFRECWDKSNSVCLKRTMIVEANETEIPCASGQQKYYASPSFNFLRSESIAVPAGTFDAHIYESEDKNAQYWYAETVPVPVKIVAIGAQTTTAELVSYKLE